MRNKYQKTIHACFIGYIVQAIINNFIPLLFMTFHQGYGIPLSKITMLITINFGMQLLIDLLSAGFIDKIGYRAAAIVAHISITLGLLALTILPDLFTDPFVGLLISVIIYATGGGLNEVLFSPIVESCPTKNKEKTMSLLHSFYCWGHVGVVLISTIFFYLFGIFNWRILAIFWAVIPFANIFLFAKVPIAPLIKDGETGLTVKQLIGQKIFWVFMLMMLSAGASEYAVSQWISTFAEQGLGVSKTVGDLAGSMAFAFLMGISRLFYGKYGDKINLDKFMTWSSILCIISYLCISLIPSPVFGLIGCAICGLSIGIMWPGTFSKASASLRGGGTAMFALFALAGDIGCTAGPTLVGIVSGALGDNLRMGIFVALIFPVLLMFGIAMCKKLRSNITHFSFIR